MEQKLEIGQRWESADGIEVVISDDFVRDGKTQFIGHFAKHPRRQGLRASTTLNDLLSRGFRPAVQRA